MIDTINDYNRIPRDTVLILAILMLVCLLVYPLSVFFGVTIGGILGITSYLSILLMVSWLLGLTKVRVRWLFPLFFACKYAVLIYLLYLVVSTPAINIIGFFLGISLVFLVICWKAIINLWYMFKFNETEKGNIDVWH